MKIINLLAVGILLLTVQAADEGDWVDVTKLPM